MSEPGRRQGTRCVESILADPHPRVVGRREWMQHSVAAAAGLGASLAAAAGRARAEDTKTPQDVEAEEMKRARESTSKVTTQPLRSLRSDHYQAVGDASAPFIKLCLSDCEKMAVDFLTHFREKGFDIKLPPRRLTVIAFRDERPFHKLAANTPPGTIGFYSVRSNWLALFDFRNAPMEARAAGQSNMETLTHEATHQLSFNTGLFLSQADIPLSIMEGVAMYCERRRIFGASAPGQPNLRRLEELAHFQRRTPWIGAADLLVDDRACFHTNMERRMLSYAESWLLVYHLMTDPDRLPQFRNYVRAIRTRRNPTRRLDDARAHFGDLARLDRDLRQEAIRLQQSR